MSDTVKPLGELLAKVEQMESRVARRIQELDDELLRIDEHARRMKQLATDLRAELVTDLQGVRAEKRLVTERIRMQEEAGHAGAVRDGRAADAAEAGGVEAQPEAEPAGGGEDRRPGGDDAGDPPGPA